MNKQEYTEYTEQEDRTDEPARQNDAGAKEAPPLPEQQPEAEAEKPVTAESKPQAASTAAREQQPEKRWYVVRAISGKEKKIKENIEAEVKRMKLNKEVSQVLIPTEKVFQIRSGKKVSKERNYFPGYILVEATLSGEVPHIIRHVPGVLGFLGSKSGEPIPLRLAEVNRILGKVDELAESHETVTIPFYVGDSVKIIDGPFNTFTGVVEEVNEEKKKLKVTVKIFGRKTPLELSYMQVEKQ